MPHVVTDNCHLCRFTECVTVCPVRCFHADEARLYIDPDVCIDCGACVSLCPVHAISDAFDLDDEGDAWIARNREAAVRLPVVGERQPPLPGAEQRRSELGF